MKLKISLGQFDVKLGRPAENLETVRRLTAEAAQRGSDMVVFPELWPTGYDLENIIEAFNYVETGQKTGIVVINVR